jgi:hypothetical protein
MIKRKGSHIISEVRFFFGLSLATSNSRKKLPYFESCVVSTILNDDTDHCCGISFIVIPKFVRIRCRCFRGGHCGSNTTIAAAVLAAPI